MGILEISGFFGILMVVLSVWAIISIIESESSMAPKALWVVAILMLPVVGLPAWVAAGPRPH